MNENKAIEPEKHVMTIRRELSEDRYIYGCICGHAILIRWPSEEHKFMKRTLAQGDKGAIHMCFQPGSELCLNLSGMTIQGAPQDLDEYLDDLVESGELDSYFTHLGFDEKM